jgi:N-acetyl-gamma-glutamyl-phosphate reductase
MIAGVKMAPKVFIDGEAGTTGLQIHRRLTERRDIELVSIEPARRKEPEARRDMLNSADLVILCLPDEAAREAVRLVESNSVGIIDASTAHRVEPGWTYGFPELSKEQRAAIASSRRVANPGCYPTGFIALTRPLIEEGLVPRDWPLTVNAVSGYTGGGKSMIAEFEDESSPAYTKVPYRIYALTLAHKHVPEMRCHAGLTHLPLFAPAVGRYAQGMIVEVPLPLKALPAAPAIKDVHAALARAYEGEPFVEVASLEEARSLKALDPEGLNGTNRMKLYVFGSDEVGQARLVALLDNLGKGASGAAVQNLNLMLGLPETSGLQQEPLVP